MERGQGIQPRERAWRDCFWTSQTAIGPIAALLCVHYEEASEAMGNREEFAGCVRQLRAQAKRRDLSVLRFDDPAPLRGIHGRADDVLRHATDGESYVITKHVADFAEHQGRIRQTAHHEAVLHHAAGHGLDVRVLPRRGKLGTHARPGLNVRLEAAEIALLELVAHGSPEQLVKHQLHVFAIAPGRPLGDAHLRLEQRTRVDFVRSDLRLDGVTAVDDLERGLLDLDQVEAFSNRGLPLLAEVRLGGKHAVYCEHSHRLPFLASGGHRIPDAGDLRGVPIDLAGHGADGAGREGRLVRAGRGEGDEQCGGTQRGKPESWH